MKNFKILLFSSLLILSNTFLKAQVKADFTSDITSGCSPLSINLRDLSTGTITSRKWTFGNGNSSTIKNPSATYAVPGKYTVTLTVSNGTITNTKTTTNYITVFANPTANFTATPPTFGCFPFTVLFNDLSVRGDAAINQWIWDFGDGTTSNNSNPTHTYTLAGSFPVSLQIIDANGCGSTKSFNQLINVSNPPKAGFTSASILTACVPPLNVVFSNTSISTGKLTYVWNFGDGSTSTLLSPSHSYTTYGAFTVKLTVSDTNGCSDVLIMPAYVNVNKVVAAFVPSKKVVCKGDVVTFTNTSTGTTGNAWAFGDGSSSTATNPNHTYALPGKYPVSLIASNGTSCKDTRVDTIVVEDVIAKFTQDIRYGCQAPLTVTYTDQSSTNVVAWEWSFGDPYNTSTSTLQNPTRTYSGKNNLGAIIYNTLITYPTLLTVTSANGCKSTYTSIVKLFIVKAAFTADPMKGCAPLTVKFTDTTVPKDSIAGYAWNFGDGNTSVQENPTNIFISEGIYKVKLIITTKSGCTSLDSLTIRVGSKPHADFTISTDTSCASDKVQFTDLSKDPTQVDEWIWSFGDNTGSGVRNPLHAYIDTGYMNVTLIVGYHGCYDTLTKPKLIYILGPVTTIATQMDCKSPLVYNFTSTIKAAHRWYWYFGDGTSDSSMTVNPTHSYPSVNPSKDYTVTLISFNDSTYCQYESKLNISVREIKAVLTINPKIGCAPLQINAISGSRDAKYFTWIWGDGSNNGNCINSPSCKCVDPSCASLFTTHTYLTAGKYKPQLIVSDVNGCKDTAQAYVGVFKPKVDFLFTPLTGCVPATFNFTDKTISDTTETKWSWDFGDNTSATDTNPSHTYLQPGNKIVTLIIKDIIGCYDTMIKKNINVTQPIADFSTNSDRMLCAGESVTFTNLASGVNLVSYIWNFGDGSALLTTSTLTHPIHQYKDTGAFTVSLTVIESNGCSATKTFNKYIDVQAKPDPQFIADITEFNCYPVLINFTDTSNARYIQSWLWDFGDNKAGSDKQNPVHNYTVPDTYSVRLTLTTTYGCTDTIIKTNYIKIGGPVADYSISRDTVCKDGDIIFKVTTKNDYAYSFQWDFGDGSPFGSGLQVTHTYTEVGTLFPRLIYADSAGTCPKSKESKIYIEEIIADFTIDSSAGCVPHGVTVADQSIGSVKWNWDLGNGTKSQLQDPAEVIYAPAGIYPVTLAVENKRGCKDTLSKNIQVYPLPAVEITKDSLICQGESIRLMASGGTTYRWTPKTTLSNDTIYNPLATPEVTTKYTVTVMDTNTCKASNSINVTVQLPPVVTLKDTTIIIGQTVNLNASAGGGFTYSWSPATGLSCTTCPNPMGKPLDSTLYTVTISDANNCFNAERSVYISVRKAYSIDVPTAFTPNGDNQNDIIYVRGWGIKELIGFKIYNRWGQLVFESNNINIGWNGYFKGQLQNMETYVYVVNALMYDDKVVSKKGNISLLR